MELSHSKVHIWHASLEATAEQLHKSHNVLADDELHRAERFHFDLDRKRFMVARALLRRILSIYTKEEPGEHSFAYNAFGKPSLNDAGCLHFSVSHSGTEAIYAISHDRDIGIDIECIRPLMYSDQIVERFFSKVEYEAFHNLPGHLRSRAFFSCWTRKEAYLKALGKGLSHPLDAFSVSFLPGEPALSISTQHSNVNEEPGWTVRDVCVNPGYVAAVVVQGYHAHFQHRQWSWQI